MGIPLETLSKMFKGMIVIFAAVLTAATAKEAKAFSLFNVVTFNNDACTSTSITTQSGARIGQCFTAEECTAKGGTASGGCAMGFGTCCLFTQSVCGGQVDNNCTHIQNDGFPTALTGTATTALPNCNYQINKAQTDVCSLRLDFLTFNTQAGNAALVTAAIGDSAGACRDTFGVITNTNGAGATPVICGQNDGQHMYIDIGPSETATTTIGFTFMALAATRSWEIKVTQLECGNPMTPPDGCLQWHTGSAGQLTTFNFAGNTFHLANQNYNICIGQEMGMTCTVYTVCAPIAGQGSPYSLSNLDAAVPPAAATAKGLSDFLCTEDYIEISGSSEVCGASVLTNKYCGDVLTTETTVAGTDNNPICDCTLPFRVGIHTDGVMDATPAANEDAGGAQSRGVCLDYKQI